MASAFFSDLLSTISERGRTLLRRGSPSDNRQDASELLELCEALLSGRGEASGTAMAREVLDRYHDLDDNGRRTFFEALARDFGPDKDKLSRATAMAVTCISPRNPGGRSWSAASTGRRAARPTWSRCVPIFSLT